MTSFVATLVDRVVTVVAWSFKSLVKFTVRYRIMPPRYRFLATIFGRVRNYGDDSYYEVHPETKRQKVYLMASVAGEEIALLVGQGQELSSKRLQYCLGGTRRPLCTPYFPSFL